MKNTTSSRAAAVILISLTCSPGAADTRRAQLIELEQRVDGALGLGIGRAASIDLDGDGVEEIVLGGTTGSAGGQFGSDSALTIVRKASDGLFDVTSRLVETDITGLWRGFFRVMPWTIDGVPHIVTLGANRMVRIYDSDLREIRNFSIAGETRDADPSAVGFDDEVAAIGDIDADGGDELVVGGRISLNAFSMTTGQRRWSLPIAGISDVALAQMDADPALEIIVAGESVALILDGATQATDWSYVDGFGQMIMPGRFGASGALGWAASSHGAFTIFQSAPYSPVWNGGQGLTNRLLAPLSRGLGGRDDILASDGVHVYLYDSATHAERFRIPVSPDPSWPNVSSLVGHDFDADADDEIFFSTGASWNSPSILTIADASNGAIRWQWRGAGGPHLATAFGDLDGDGRDELVAATEQPQQQLGTLSVFDASTGRLKWRNPIDWPNATQPFVLSASRIQLRPRTESAGMDIILAGDEYEGGRILVVDGATFEPKLRIDDATLGEAGDLVLLDYDGDGVEDFAVVSNTSNTSTLGIFSGVNGLQLWRSPAMSGRTRQILVVDKDQRTELIAVLDDGLRAYDRVTGLLDWWLTADTSAGAVYVEHGAQGAEIAALSATGAITFHDADSRALLRTHVLAPPVRTATAIDGDVHSLLVASGERLVLIDGATGDRLAESAAMSPFRRQGAHLSLHRESGDTWTVASGTHPVLYRHRLVLGDHLFTDGFDSR